MSLDTVITALEPYNVRKTYNGWHAKCPSHDDNKASLTIGTGSDGRALVKCMAGCETVDIVEALGLVMGDLFEAKPETPGIMQFAKSRIAATYSYYDEKGVLLYEVVRFDPKDFRQRRPDGKGGHIWKLDDTRRVLYRLPELLAAARDLPVFVVEGEKDADALAALGLVSTCNVGGAGKWRPEYTKALAGRRVVILPDNDDPGRAHAKLVHMALGAGSVVVELPGLPIKGDVSDWMAMGGNRARLEALIPAPSTNTADGFQTSAERIVGEHAERIAEEPRILEFGVAYLDHALGGIAPCDLVLLGAKTGVGKTALATITALHNCQLGKRVHFFALEAEDREIERRMKYSIIAGEYFRTTGPDRVAIRYQDWRLGRLEKVLGSYEAMADMDLRRALRNLHTFYPRSAFTAEGFCAQLERIKDETDLVILDHLHYVDNEESDENRGYKRMVKTIRQAAIGLGKPVIVVAHIRKSDRQNKLLVPDVEDFHGSSDIPKIATKAIMLAPASDHPTGKSYMWNTYMQIAKCRTDSSVTRYTALVPFNARLNSYDAGYVVGRVAYDAEERGHRFQHLIGDDLPSWAAPGSNGSGL